MFRSLLLMLLAVSCNVAHALGEAEVKLKLIAMDGYGYVRFQSKQPLPAGIGDGCTTSDWFTVEGDPNIDYRNTTAYKAMVSSLQAAVLMDLPVVIFVNGCGGPSHNNNDNSVWWVRLPNPVP